VPIAYRDLRVLIDRPEFTFNPTDCDTKAIEARLLSTTAQVATASSPFQAINCAKLGFKPKLSLRLKGSTHRTANPALIANLIPRAGDADIGYAQVTLPRSAFLDNAHIGTICTRVQFKAGAGSGANCPAASIYGKAQVTTPLLDYPLVGTVFLRASDHTLPDLVVAFTGPDSDPIAFTLAGRTDSVNGALRNTFESTPDVPVSKFRLELFGGKSGLIEMSSGFCAHPRAKIRLEGQNGKLHDTTPVVSSACTKKHRHHKRAGFDRSPNGRRARRAAIR
jgi:hypothetical protein